MAIPRAQVEKRLAKPMESTAMPFPGDLLAVEVDDSGFATGVEAEDVGEHIDEPFDPEKIEVLTRNLTVGLLLSRIRRGTIDLAPDFQRKSGIWTATAQSRLIESMLLRIALPTLYAAEGDNDSWAVVDGVQRLTTITRFVDPQAIGAERLKLSGLEYLQEFNGRTFDDLPGRLKTRIEETELIVLLIRRGTPEAVKFNIFARINTGGRPLTRQELRHALIPGQARGFLAELADTSEFKLATGGSVSAERMSDREMCLRFLAFRINPPEMYRKQDFDGFLRDAMHQLNKLSVRQLEEIGASFREAMNSAREVFGDHAFRKRSVEPSLRNRRNPVNKALFEAEAVGLARWKPEQRVVLSRRSAEVEERFLKLMDDAKFVSAISVATGDVGKVRLRFGAVERILQEVLDA